MNDLPGGCRTAEEWAAVLNLPLKSVYAGSTVFPTFYQTPVTFVSCDHSGGGWSPFSNPWRW